MANIKSSKKRARQAIVKRERNLSRKTALKTAVKKIITALESGDVAAAKASFQEAQAKIARARGKGVLHKNTASRKVSRLAQRIASADSAK